MYELILQGITADAETTRLTETLRKHGSLPGGELASAFEQGPVTIDIASARGDLLPLYRELKSSGGEVSIVNRSLGKSVDQTANLIRHTHEKKRTLEELRHTIEHLKCSQQRIVLVHGVFDILHIGHIRLLNHAKELGDILVVSVASDASVGRGPGSPFFTESLRMETLANLAAVDFVTSVESPHAVPVIEAIKPDVIVRGQHVSREKFDFKAEHSTLEDSAIRMHGGRGVSVKARNHSTSELVHQFFEIYPQRTSAFLAEFAHRWSISTIIDALEQCAKLKVLVIGDTIIDHYHYCNPLGKSAKENLVVNKSHSEETFAGGIIATANHVAQLCERVDVLTVLGAEDSYEDFIREKLNRRVTPRFFYRETGPTTVKKRYVTNGSNQKLFEICDMNDSQLNDSEESSSAEFLNAHIDEYDLVIVNDFGHGMQTPRLMDIISSQAQNLALNVQVNGANQGFNLVTNYPNADFVCIDERELRLSTRERHAPVKELMRKISNQLGSHLMIATLGGDGSLSMSRDEGFHETPAFATSSVDKVGAGDAFFAYTAPCFAVGIPQDLISFIGNCVGALKVQIVGNKEQVRLPDVIRFIERLLKA